VICVSRQTSTKHLSRNRHALNNVLSPCVVHDVRSVAELPARLSWCVVRNDAKAGGNLMRTIYRWTMAEAFQSVKPLAALLRLGQGRNEGGKEAQLPGRWITAGAPNDCGGRRKVPTISQAFFFNTVQFLPKDLEFEHGGAKLASCPGRHLTSLRPWRGSRLLDWNGLACVKISEQCCKCLLLLLHVVDIALNR